MDENKLTEEEFLAAYDASKWPHPALTADVALFRCVDERLQLLLIKRANHPYQDCYALPGGFFEPGETIEQTAAREMAEEVGIEGVALELFGIYSTPGRDPRDWVVTAAFLALVPDNVEACAGDDAAAAQWFDVEVSPCNDGSIALELTHASKHLRVRFTMEEGPVVGNAKAQVIEHEGFAFDHYAIIADAWANLKGKVR